MNTTEQAINKRERKIAALTRRRDTIETCLVERRGNNFRDVRTNFRGRYIWPLRLDRRCAVSAKKCRRW